MKWLIKLVFTVYLLLYGCGKNEEKLFRLLDSGTTKIHFKNVLRDTPELNILTYLYYYNGAGVAAADFNGDNLIDLYFTSNMGNDQLYINRGNMRFSEVTGQANIINGEGWTTGVTHVDINADGLLDLYICKVGNYQNLRGKNLLYINKGVNENGVPVFSEESAEYGLDFSGFSTQASFFDYDLDGDLDMYLLNHSVHPNRAYGKGTQRNQVDDMSGDKLYRNDNRLFTDVSEKAGIFQGKIGYGLGIAISDVNNDGYPDIYVGNDFFENDYLYINQQNGSFEEMISKDEKLLGHTSHYSMGNDIADINNDGLMDIISLDMLPENLETYKTSGFEYPFPTYDYYLKNGYSPQYMQNTLHLNLGNGRFGEIANLAGVSATEWSWGPLIADFDNDGYKDIYIANGIKGATNDMDFINFIANDNIQKRISAGMNDTDMGFISEIPEKKVPNYFFKNNGGLVFEDITNKWFEKIDSFSTGCVFADLDNDGDLDIVVNNLDEEAFVIENLSRQLTANNHLQIEFKGLASNKFGIGAKVLAFHKGAVLSRENYVSRGYLSAVPPAAHLGLGNSVSLDSLLVLWPSGKYQRLLRIPANQKVILNESDAAGNYYQDRILQTSKPFMLNTESLVDFTHREGGTLDFIRDPLIPFANSHEGPSLAIGDINFDGREDLLIGGAKLQASVLYLQNKDGVFEMAQEELFEEDSLSEDVSQIIADLNGDMAPDLLIVSAGNEFRQGKALRPRVYFNRGGYLEKDSTQFRDIEMNASGVSVVDYDLDGDLDVLITSDQVPLAFGENPRQYFLENDGSGKFTDITQKIFGKSWTPGNIKDVAWIDLDGNGYEDLVVVGHWMPISIYLNDGQHLNLQKDNRLNTTEGWWNAVQAGDFDKDGDIDFIAGNWGLNSRLKASASYPVTLYNYDFDDNGHVDPLVTYYYKGKETPFASKDELVKQLPFLNKKYLSYKSFAKASMEDLFSRDLLFRASKKKVEELETSVFLNDGNGNFTKGDLPPITQASTIQDIALHDFNSDGFPDLFMAGNNYEISTQLGRMDALHGLILLNNKKGGFEWYNNQSFHVSGPARKIKKIRVKDQDFFCIAINNDSPIFLRINKN